jgi:hypothetical protein
MKAIKTFAAVMMFALPVFVSAEDAVIQGGGPSLHSPAIFSGPFPLADRSLWGKGGWFGYGEYTDAEVFKAWYVVHCDGVAISEFRMRGKPDGANLRVQLKGKYYNDLSGHDKQVELTVRVLKGTQVLASSSDRTKVEEGDHAAFTLDLDIPQHALDAPPAPTIQATMKTRDD